MFPEGRNKLLVCRVIKGRAVVQGRYRANRFVSHGRKYMFIRGRTATDKGNLSLESVIIVLFYELQCSGTEEEGLNKARNPGFRQGSTTSV